MDHPELFVVDVGPAHLAVEVLSPPHLAPSPALLLTFAGARQDSLHSEPYCLAARAFLAAGYRAASFSLPSHGEREDADGEGITGWRNKLMAGQDVFGDFVREGRAVISACIERGLAQAGRVAAAGTSRGGYMALRLMAGDGRLAAAAGFAPVTDWRYLDEFAGDRGEPVVAAQALHRLVPELAGRAVYLTIGGSDDRVSTDACRDLAEQLRAANDRPELVMFDLTEDEGHSLGPPGYARGAAFLLRALEGTL